MAASVLGKRARSSLTEGTTQDSIAPSKCHNANSDFTKVASPQPPRKRVTRRSTPQIYEDVVDSSAAAVPAKTASTRSRARFVKSKAQQKSPISTEDVELRDAPSAVQDENCPPADFVCSTPSANKFKDALSSIPSTPKHRVRVLGGLLTPTTPRTYDATIPRAQNVYAQARQLFTQSATPSRLVGRETERQQLKTFISNARDARQGGCTYISGPPGTGKSALVHEILQDFEHDAKICTSVINCVGLRTAAQVYGKLLEDLSPLTTSKASPELQLRKVFTSKSGSKTFVVILDEVDSLLHTECETLYNIFEWALHPSSSLALIGIANALDLTDRFLPRLKSKGLKPQLLPFLPYTAQQITTILTDKLRTLLPKHTTAARDFVPCVHPSAIQLCGKKIAAQTGDLRKAFNLIRRAIDQVEKDTVAKQAQNSPSKQALGELANASCSVRSPQKSTLTFSTETAPRASIAHVAKLASSIFNNGTISRLSGLNLQQKAVLCSIVNKESRRQQRDLYSTPTKTANKAPTVGELFTKYMSLCKRDDGILQPLKDTEFRDVVASLETLGLVHESKARSSSLLTPSSSSRNGISSNERQIASAVSEKEMRESMTGAGADLLKRLLDEI